MNLTYAVTFEQPLTAPPLTVRGQVVATNPATAAARAIKAAKRQAKGKHWDSLVIVLERCEA